MPSLRPLSFSALAALAGALTPAAAHAADGVPAIGALALRAGLSLGAVLGAIALLAWLLKRLSPSAVGGSSSKRLASVARLDLGARRELRLVQADGQLILVSVTADRVEFLRDVAPAATSTSHEETPALHVLQKLTTS